MKFFPTGKPFAHKTNHKNKCSTLLGKKLEGFLPFYSRKSLFLFVLAFDDMAILIQQVPREVFLYVLRTSLDTVDKQT